MREADALRELLTLASPVFTSSEAATRLGLTASRTSQILGSLERAGLATKLRHGLWTVDRDLDPFVLPAFLTAPLPSYVSYWTALAFHGSIEQIPRAIYVASLGKASVVSTPVGVYSIHHIAPALFGGYSTPRAHVFIATVEKALFDVAYFRASRGGPLRMPELELPPGFDPAESLSWAAEVSPPALRTRVHRALSTLLESVSDR